jgi:hypothetical protein
MHEEVLDEEILELAILLPADVVDVVRRDIPSKEEKCAITTSVAPAAESTSSLGFDPASLGSLAWVAITFIGTTVAPVAQKIVRDYMWRTYQNWINRQQSPGLIIRLRNGKQITLRSDNPEDLQEFQNWLEKNTKKPRK